MINCLLMCDVCINDILFSSYYRMTMPKHILIVSIVFCIFSCFIFTVFDYQIHSFKMLTQIMEIP